ncbi:PHD and RING finger domain-containing protein 1 [Camellia lanceoleosa]|uniref:PHD and RING finger domain-containing protein 1 n=1 Tax=Camellia lanceoleosa TaxID=1840588 RepID=A0ACC0I2R2_9ERIC|nr:PHD and RING finger domain-containing protein 1 [Camellia lanceoleosa]
MASDSHTTWSPSSSPNQTLNPEIPQNKRPKTLIPTITSPPPSSPSSSKGKDLLICNESTTLFDSESQCCGICLSEDGMVAIRGKIDSCDHYFCFVCIMEWAKVESRCPMCKRRFSSIRRPPRDGVFLAERVVNVPVRDQIYHCFGNATVGPSDPYSEVRCTVCDSARDESLLLLCDLCDSAVHTYCVGLGATVPEGDWFCQDCTVSKAEHKKSETDTDCDSQMSSINFQKAPLAESHVSIRDIVRESSSRELERPPTAVLPHPTSLADSTTEQGSRTQPSIAPTATDSGARTLRRCRNVQGRIQTLRENWNAFRSGSLSFTSSSVDSSGNTNQRHSGGAILSDRSGQTHSTPCSSQHLVAQKGSSSDTIPNRSSYNVEKAWKMMDVAKRAHERASVVNQASKHTLSKVNTPIEKAKASSSLLPSCRKPVGTKDLSNTVLQKQGNDRPQIGVKQEQSIVTTKRILKFGETSLSAQSPRDHDLPSSRKAQTSVQVDVCYRNGGKLPQENLPAVSSNVFNERDRSACLITTPAWPVTATSKASCAKPDIVSSSKMRLPNEKATVDKSCAGSKSRRDDDAKSEIQSLVKLNLKLLTRDRKLGVDAFKEIARHATHSILAACGLEHPKPGVHSFPSSACCHTNQAQQPRMSTLMPSTCRECFYVFVKDVVNAIMVEKIGGA